MAERGIVISRETIPCWVIEFGLLIVAKLRLHRGRPTGRGHSQTMMRFQGASSAVMLNVRPFLHRP